MMHVTTEQMREIDRRAIQDIGIPGVALMESAGRRVFEELTQMVVPADGTVLVLCGKGNNGGDGFVVARHLVNNGYDVEVYLVGSANEVAGEAATNLGVVQRMGVPVHEVRTEPDVSAVRSKLDEAALIIDALLGTGLRGEVSGVYAVLIAAVNGSQVPVLSVDIPSGLDGDTGTPLGAAVRATKTVTFQYPKRGFTNRSAGQFIGKLVVADIGIPAICAEGIA
jgi:NAD(P)H-hydrate epimerase